MTSNHGTFFSAQDADTDGEEGKTFVWKKKEITEILQNDSELFCIYYDVTDGGNFEGQTILANNVNTSALAFKFDIPEDKIKEKIKFYINIGTGTLRKGYSFIPKALAKMKGNVIKRIFKPEHHEYAFIATAVENSQHRVKKSFQKYFQKTPK